MFRLKSPDVAFPERYEHVIRELPTAKSKGFDRVGDFTLREKKDFIPQPGLQENFIRCESNIIFLCGAATMGKEQPYDADVLTPRGFVKMGDLKVGDVICGADGGEQRVLAIFEQGIKDVYRFTMADGGVVESGLEHLWLVRKSLRKKKSEWSIETTRDIIDAFDNRGESYGSVRKISFPTAGPVKYRNEVEPTVSPYTLGQLIADGCVTCQPVRIYTADEYCIERVKIEGYAPQKLASDKYGYSIHSRELVSRLKTLGIYGHTAKDKRLPEECFHYSVENRVALLQGLMDADGHCMRKTGSVEYSSISEGLAVDVQRLCRSLGYVARVIRKKTTCRYKGELVEGVAFRVRIIANNAAELFGLERKKANSNRDKTGTGYDALRHLASYEYVGKKQCRCIWVSNEDHLYVTNDFIVTHNTYSMLMKFLIGMDRPGFAGRFISMRLADSKKGTSIYRDAVELLGNFADCEVSSSDSPTFAWPKWNSAVQLIHSNFNVENPTEWDDFKELAKKNQASEIQVDEGSDMPFKMFTYWMSRNRDSSGLRPQITMSFNPEFTHWTTTFLLNGGYIDPDTFYIKPNMNGRTRYVYFLGDDVNDVVWGDTAKEVAAAAGVVLSEADRKAGLTEEDMVKTFTMFTGEAADNLKLVAATGGGSIANLHATGATQRNVLKGAYFGPTNNERSSVTKQMVLDLPTNPISDDENMYATMDISGAESNSDVCQMIIWKGLRIIAIEAYKGDMKQIVPWIEGKLSQYGVPMSNFAFDATGMGFFLKSYINANPITSNKAAIQEIDENGNPVTFEQYFNIRSQLLGKTRVLFETGKISTSLSLDRRYQYGKKGLMRTLRDILFDEIDLFVSTTRNKRIYYLSKDEYKSRHQKNSPDLMDSICLRAFFELDARPKKQPSPQVEENAYSGLFNRFRGGQRQRKVWI